MSDSERQGGRASDRETRRQGVKKRDKVTMPKQIDKVTGRQTESYGDRASDRETGVTGCQTERQGDRATDREQS